MTRRRTLRLVVAGVAGVLVVLLLAAVAVTTTVIRRPLPDHDGEAVLADLGAEVTVLRDERGVPQVYADTATDLFMAQGFVHAQDRFFEMDFRRHVTAGRLSELVGENDDALTADAAIRTMGWRRVAEQELRLLEPETRDYLEAYADGVNAYLRERSPAELSVSYTVLGLRNDELAIEPWTPVDSLAWLKAMAWDLRGNYTDELTRARLSGTLDRDRIDQLYPAYPEDRHLPITDGTQGASARQTVNVGTAAPAPPMSADARRAMEAVDRVLAAVPTTVGTGEGVGSNSWVVSGEHTESGLPLLANDPHLAPSIPGVWYQMGLHCTEVSAACPFEVAGFSFAGLPGIVIGHNAEIAWGFTNLGPDVTDFFLEKVTGDTYLRDDEQVPLTTRTETIEIAGADPVDITVRSTVHGPLLSDRDDVLAGIGRLDTVLPEDAQLDAPPRSAGYGVSLAWTALTPGKTADAIFALDVASDWDEFQDAARLFEVPAQNLLYADTTGRIGYQAPGIVPVRGNGDGRYPAPGWDSSYDWTGSVPFEDLPSVTDPDEGFLVAANQAAAPLDGDPQLTTDWDYGYRSQRIRDLLAERIQAGPITTETMTAMQRDTVNGSAATLVPHLLRVDAGSDPFITGAQQLLRGWDGSQPADSAPAAYYNAVWASVLRLTFHDDLPTGLEPDGGGRWFEVVRTLLDQPQDPFWDDRSTPNVVETRDGILARALVDARLELTRDLGKDPQDWEWGKLHRLVLTQQPLGGDGVPAPVRALVNHGPLELGGGSAIVDATGWDAASGDYVVTWVPSMRMVVDLADLDASRWVNLTGSSGHPASDHYTDQVDTWAEGGTYAWPFEADAVTEATVDTLVLRPESPPS